MSSADPLAALPVGERNELETLLMEFDEAWDPSLLHSYGNRVASNADSQFRNLALVELVKVDLQRSWSAGTGRWLEEYLKQFPSLGNAESVTADLIVAEFKARKSLDSTLNLASYKSRFPNQSQRVEQLASELLDSLASTPPKPTKEALTQASIDTSRVDQLRDTKDGKQHDTVADLPVEFGRYRILKELGAGAMGKVYLAHDRQLDRQVALKTPSFSGPADKDMVTRFVREARAAAKIQHRNICPVYDVGEIDGRHFISMAFVKGRCMSEFIQSDKLPPQRTSAILVQRLAIALERAHRHNVIHRDLKPANIMIDSDKEPVVMDFGLARQTDVESRLTQSGMAVGTPAYMSPEQIRGELDEVDATADIYALGVILYELLTGQLPFRGSIAKVVYNIVNEEAVAPSQIRDDIAPELESICAKMMSKQRADRFQSMGDVADALKVYLKGKKQTVKPEASKARSSIDSKAKSGAEPLTETAALNAFFVGQVSQDPSHTRIEPRQKPEPSLATHRPSDSSSSGGGGRTKLVTLGLGGFALLASVIIYFSDGSRVEIKDGTHAEVEMNPDGTLKSIKTSPLPASQSSTSNSVASRTGESDNAQTGFVDLFNGTDLSGWRGVDGLWKWQDGELVGAVRLDEKTLSHNTALCSTRMYQDFELKFEVKLEGHSNIVLDANPPNSGIQFRSRIVDDTSFKVAGPQADIGGKYWGGLWGEASGGMMHKVDARLIESIVKEGDWNQYRLTVNGDRVSIRLNGVETVNRSFPNLPKDGILGFQLHRGLSMTARFRNIQIRELAQLQPAPAIAPFTPVEAQRHQEAWAKHLGVEVETTNSIGMKFRVIPPGEFVMGSSDSEESTWVKHRVTLTKPFGFAIHEVTRGQFRKFVEATGYKTQAEKSGKGGFGYRNMRMVQAPEFVWNSNLGFETEQTDDHPVANVSWSDAVAFCEWLSKKEGIIYRLPKEAEWEFACRAGNSGAYCFGDDEYKLDKYAWYAHQDGIGTKSVGQKSPNAFGLFDVHGNVWEWCYDYFGPYTKAPVIDPVGTAGTNRRVHVLRGGSFSNQRIDRIRSDYRTYPPVRPVERFVFNGFRVARSFEK